MHVFPNPVTNNDHTWCYIFSAWFLDTRISFNFVLDILQLFVLGNAKYPKRNIEIAIPDSRNLVPSQESQSRFSFKGFKGYTARLLP